MTTKPDWLSAAYAFIRGGWKTWGPGASFTPAGFADDGSELYALVSEEAAQKLSAWYAALHLRGEVTGSFPIQIMDDKLNVLTQHPLYEQLRYRANADMTGPEMVSAWTYNYDTHGNALSIIDRRSTGRITSITPIPTSKVQVKKDDSGNYIYEYDGNTFTQDEILLLKGFSANGYFGIPPIQAARNVLSSQVQSGDAAMRNFKNGLRVGGFFKTENDKAMTPEQTKEYESYMAKYRDPNRQNTWMPLPKGFEPVGGNQFRMSSVDSELLSSRHFGIEEICRFHAVPPPLIGHTDKASSWASSLEALFLHLITFSLAPTAVRYERRMEMQLLTREDRARGISIKFNMNSLLRGDIASRMKFYDTMQKNGNFSQNEVRAWENLPGIGIDGDVYRTQLNMTSNDSNPENQK